MDDKRLDDALDLARARRRLPSPEARRLLRERSGLSQGDIARAVGVTRTAISLWESGAREPRAVNLHRYVQLLNGLASETLR